ncbi:MAG: penicillin-binding transpeptidase domain-containing protein [Candidatus Latescibacterota bacterium]
MNPLAGSTPDGAHRRRLRILALAGCTLWLGLAGRLMQVQAVQHAEYARRARGQHERSVEVKAHRGRILDRRGRLLAADVGAYSYFANPALVTDAGAVARHFAPLGGQSAFALEQQLRGDGHFVYLARQLDDTALARAEEQDFRGVHRHAETKRIYPLGRLAGQLLGYTNIDNRGSEGLEWAFEELLRQHHGAARLAVTARGEQVPRSLREQLPPEDGNSVILTIDTHYQDILEQEIERAIEESRAEAGTGIIMDPHSGQILAMATLPLYDPNNPGQTDPRWRRNRSVTDAYEPGSTFKVVAFSAALEEGAVRPEETIDCENGRLTVGNGQVIRDHDPYGLLTAAEVLAHSSNIGTIKIARRLPRPVFYEYIRNYGFAVRTTIGLPGESTGMLREVDQWSARSHETIAIGQEISVTALQLAQCYAAIANGGELLAPQIVKGVAHGDGRYEERARRQVVRRVISPGTAATMRRLLTGVVEEGTGGKARIEGLAIAGKTGTAQQVAENGTGYDPRECVASFVGFLPADDPRLLCLVAIDNPRLNRWGGSTAAPAFRRTVERILYLPDTPDIAPPPPAEAREARPVAVSIPDLRGLTDQVARFQANLRGLSVRFAGSGPVVTQQTPAPGPAAEGVAQITCTLGEPEASAEAALAAADTAAVVLADSVLDAPTDSSAAPPPVAEALARQVQLLRVLSGADEAATTQRL